MLIADFLDAYRRHWDDAEQLFNAGRWANADHLFGFAAECGLKRLMVAFGMNCDVNGSPVRQKDRKHVNELWNRFESYRSGSAHGTGYLLPAIDPFTDWLVSDRYATQGAFGQVRTQGHRVGADVVGKQINKALRDGLI